VPRSGGKEVAVGAVVSAAAVIVAVALISVGAGQSFFRRQVEYKVRFDNTTGLGEGSPVKLVGVQIGTVGSISLPDDLNQKYILVTLSIDRAFHDRIREDSEASLKYLTLLGGEKFVEITPGSLTRAILPPGSFISVPRAGGLEALTARSEDIAADLQVISSFFRRTVEQIERGEGVLGQILSNPEFGSETLGSLRQSTASLSRISAGIERGEGLAGRLLMDREYGRRQSEQIDSALSRLNSILAAMENPEGAVGDLLSKEGQARKAIAELAQVLASLNSVLEALDRGEGLAGRLLGDKEYGERISSNLEKLTANLASITSKIDRGDGTLGQLINDPSVVQGLKDVMYGMQKSRIIGSLIRRYREKGEQARAEGRQEEGAQP
jgi:phospholipid/cholesterol/gamma-HCH transport system substrate-binding protein